MMQLERLRSAELIGERLGTDDGSGRSCCSAAVAVSILSAVFWMLALYVSSRAGIAPISTAGIAAFGCGIFAFLLCICSAVMTTGR